MRVFKGYFLTLLFIGFLFLGFILLTVGAIIYFLISFAAEALKGFMEGVAAFKEQPIEIFALSMVSLYLASKIIGEEREKTVKALIFALILTVFTVHNPVLAVLLVLPILILEEERVKRGFMQLIETLKGHVKIKSLTELTGLRKQEEKKPTHPVEKIIETGGRDKNYVLGVYYSGLKFKVPLEELKRNMLVAGSTGTGKTNLMMKIVKETCKDIGYWVFDQKNEYRKLLEFINSVRVYSIGGNLKINLLENPLNVEDETWIPALAECFCHAYNLKEPSRNILQRAIQRVKANRIKPKLVDLIEEVKLFRVRSEGERGSWRSTLSRLELLTFGNMGKTFNTTNGLKIDEIIEGVTVFNLSTVGSIEDRKFIVEILVNALYEYLRRNKAEKHLKVIVEESHNYLPEERPPEKRGVYSRAETVFAELREFNSSMVAIDQQPSMLSSFVLANTPTKFFFRLERENDVELACSFLGLNKEQTSWKIRNLKTGEAYVKLTGKPLYPAQVKIKPITLKEKGEKLHIEDCLAELIHLKIEKKALTLENISKALGKERKETLTLLREMEGKGLGKILKAGKNKYFFKLKEEFK